MILYRLILGYIERRLQKDILLGSSFRSFEILKILTCYADR